ncbi:MAG: hypothetical protein ACE5HH_04100 [Candidatus Hydrothermarchaeales archaeon]
MIATVIKKQYLEEIEAGIKTIEYRACSQFWTRRINGKRHGAILFLCGRKCKGYRIKKIETERTPEDLKSIINTDSSFAIYLAGRYRWPEQMRLF